MNESVITDAVRERVLFVETLLLDGCTVVVTRDDQFFLTHCLECDYAAYGSSRDDAITAFKRGFIATLLLNMDTRFKGIERPCPPNLWAELTQQPEAELLRVSFTLSS